MVLRKPSVKDVPELVAFINQNLDQDALLPRSQHYVFQNLRDFVLAEEEGQIIGCASLHVLWDDIAEIRTVALAPEARGNGLFRELVDYLLEDGRRLGVQRVFSLTARPEPFVEVGFSPVERDNLPQIVWRDCIECIYFPHCRETAVLIDLHAGAEGIPS